MHGSSFLNERFEALLLKKLEDEHYLETRGVTIDGIVNAAMVEFENDMKRTVDVIKPRPLNYPVQLRGLMANKIKNFRDNTMILTR